MINYEKQNKTVDKISSLLNKDQILKGFKFYEDFKFQWINLLKENSNRLVLYCDLKSLCDDSQIFKYKFQMNNMNIELCFDITYLRFFYSKIGNKIQTINFDICDKHILLDNFKCYYNKNIRYKDCDKNYSDMSDIFVIPLPTDYFQFIIVDGNHRVCKQIYNGAKKLSGIYFDYPIAGRALISPFQICIYAFIEDLQKIKYNVNKLNHDVIYKSLNINDRNRLLNEIKKREKDVSK